jgi:CheY-like chemotaxis protein
VVSGKIVLKKQLIDLRQIVRQCAQTMRDSGQARHLRLEVRDCDGPLMVFADPVRAEQIISNVLTNAVKYTPDDGHVVVTIDRDARDNAVIRVSDDGVGIAPERIGTIFELFAQAENAIGRSQGGMGIGLALVRNLIELHGGTVSATSEGVGKGSEFVVRIPLAKAAEHTTEKARTAPAAAELQRRRSIVIVEDNPDVRELLQLKLRKLGHDVDAAADGPNGVNCIVKTKPDLALIDIGLPGLDGYEVAMQVRKELHEDIVLIAVSGFGQPEDKRKALEAGFDEHLTKPADVRDIEDVLNRFPPRNSSTAGSVVR